MSTINNAKGREDLKKLFSNGKIPTEEHFANVFDSFLNFQDDRVENSQDTDQTIKFKDYVCIENKLIIGDQQQVNTTVNNGSSVTITKNQILLQNGNIQGIAEGQNPQDAINKRQMDAADAATLKAAKDYTNSNTGKASLITDFDQQVRKSTLDQMAKPLADININNSKLTFVANPTNPQDAATKSYVDTSRPEIRSWIISVGDILGGDLNLLNPLPGLTRVTKARSTFQHNIITISYYDRGYVPVVHVTVSNTIRDWTADKIYVPILLSCTKTSTEISLEESVGVYQDISLHIILVQPSG